MDGSGIDAASEAHAFTTTNSAKADCIVAYGVYNRNQAKADKATYVERVAEGRVVAGELMRAEEGAASLEGVAMAKEERDLVERVALAREE
eukprot:1151796-Pelagomonas_calceolata.AAC.1